MDVKLFFPIDDPKRIVLRNPIARAIAAQKLTQQIRKFCIGLYQLREGEEVVREAEHAATVIWSVLESMYTMGLEDEADARVLRAGVKVLTELAERKFLWRPSYASTVDRSLQICAARYPKIPSNVLYEAYGTMEKGDNNTLIAAIKARMVPA